MRPVVVMSTPSFGNFSSSGRDENTESSEISIDLQRRAPQDFQKKTRACAGCNGDAEHRHVARDLFNCHSSDSTCDTAFVPVVLIGHSSVLMCAHLAATRHAKLITLDARWGCAQGHQIHTS